MWKVLGALVLWWLLRRLWGVVKVIVGLCALLEGLKALTGM